MPDEIDAGVEALKAVLASAQAEKARLVVMCEGMREEFELVTRELCEAAEVEYSDDLAGVANVRRVTRSLEGG